MTFLLLEEEDAEVRGRMTSILPAIDPNIKDPAPAVLTVDILLEKMLDIRLCPDPRGCVTLLLDLITRDASCLQDGKVGVFDKSEINTYSENVTMAAIAAKHLEAVIRGEREVTDDREYCHGDSAGQDGSNHKMKSCVTLRNTEDYLKRKVYAFASEELLTLLVKEAVANVCEKLETLLAEYNSHCCLKDVYLRTGQYEWSVCLMSRLVLTLTILTCAEVFRHTDYSQRVFQKAIDVIGSQTCNNLMAEHLTLLSQQPNLSQSL
ncbi:uncharacterized protein LOC135469161 isoform X2 [Liolophura sinensis]|uniref:uncharacterized protein LOC135469161 isoform X2 n=1 Tax=Liolophura sinensis TaxID=3198878 RepID=UPI0031590B80